MIRAALLTLCLAAPAAAETITGRPIVVDGDSLRFGTAAVRLAGIDAPEWNQTCAFDGKPYACGQAATVFLRRLIDGQVVTCLGVMQKDGTVRDRHGRFLGRCSAGPVALNAEMVESGHALAYRRFSVELAPHEDRARLAQRGMWRGKFQAPWDFRATR
jgi:endonuclease YncB( thermonuclease family)